MKIPTNRPPDFNHCYQMLKQARGSPHNIDIGKLLGTSGRNDGGLIERTLRDAEAYIKHLENQKNHAEVEMEKMAAATQKPVDVPSPPRVKRQTPF